MILEITNTTFSDSLFGFFKLANSYSWSAVIVILIGCAVYFTIRSGFVQLRIPGGLKAVFKSRKGRDKKNSISAFQAFAISLAGRVGTGNIAGVAAAIHVGGPGSVFWMWIMAFFGAATSFVECTLAQLYKRKGDRTFYGGPSYYMLHGLGKRWMGLLFSIFLMLNMCLGFPLVQSSTMYDSMSETLGLDKIWVAVVISVISLVVFFGGIHRISKFSTVVVPFMALSYLLITLYVIATNLNILPSVFSLIFDSAFNPEAVGGGTLGIVISQGIKRGLFSNEAGEGSTPNAAATADVSHPVKQGLNQAIGVFADTLIICSCSALIILISGKYSTGLDGINLVKSAMCETVGRAGDWFVSFAILFFAFSTLIANYLYGEINLKFIFGKRSSQALSVFRIYNGIIIFCGAFVTLQEAFDVVDFFTALMSLTNLVAIVILSPQVFKLLKNYVNKIKKGEDPEFHASEMPEIADKLEAWND